MTVQQVAFEVDFDPIVRIREQVNRVWEMVMKQAVMTVVSGRESVSGELSWSRENIQ